VLCAITHSRAVIATEWQPHRMFCRHRGVHRQECNCSEWNDLCPEMQDEIRKHLSLADYSRACHLSRDFLTASRVRQAKAEQHLLSTARDACSPYFIFRLGRAIRNYQTRTLTCPVDLLKGGNGVGGAHSWGNVDADSPVPLGSFPIRAEAGPQGLWLEVVTSCFPSFFGARCASFRFAVKGAVTGESLWGYLIVFSWSPKATPAVWLWLEPRHAIPLVLLLCCTSMDGMLSGDVNTSDLPWGSPVSQTLVRDVLRVVRGSKLRGGLCGKGGVDLEDELIAGASLLNRYLGTLRISGAVSPAWAEDKFRFATSVVSEIATCRPMLVFYFALMVCVGVGLLPLFMSGSVAFLAVMVSVLMLYVWGMLAFALCLLAFCVGAILWLSLTLVTCEVWKRTSGMVSWIRACMIRINEGLGALIKDLLGISFADK
jgi:hypothetical protein